MGFGVCVLSATLTCFPLEQKPLSVRNIGKNISNYELQRHNLWRPRCQEWRQWKHAAAPHPPDSWKRSDQLTLEEWRAFAKAATLGYFLLLAICVLCSINANGGRLEHTFVLKDVIMAAFFCFDSHDKITCSWLQSTLNAEHNQSRPSRLNSLFNLPGGYALADKLRVK